MVKETDEITRSDGNAGVCIFGNALILGKVNLFNFVVVGRLLLNACLQFLIVRTCIN